MSLFHQILGVEENASLEDIKKQYRLLCKMYHPDVSQYDSIAKISLINEAYNELIHDSNNKNQGNTNVSHNNEEDVVLYKDQAYAFYRKGLDIYRQINKDRIETGEVIHDSKKLMEYERKVLESLYYMNIVYIEYSNSPWCDDAIDTIKALNRNRQYISNVKKYMNNKKN